MATTPSKGKGAGKKAKQRRIYLALGLVALAVIGYLWYRGRSSASLASSPSGASAAGFPSSSEDSGSAGGLAGTPDTQGAGLLSALGAENQSLIDALLGNRPSVAVGGTTNEQPVADQTPQLVAPEAAASSPGPGAAAVPSPAPSPSLQSIVASEAATLVPQTAAPASVQGTLGPPTQTVQYNPPTPVYNAPSIDQAAADIAASYGDTSGGQPTPVDNAAPPPVYSPPVYGITYGPPAGQRATSGSKGVQTIH